MLVTVVSANVLDLYKDSAEEDRYRQVEELLRAVGPDILAVQEIISDGATRAEKLPGAIAGLRRLAEATGLRADIDGDPLVAVGGIMHHPAILYRDCPQIRPRTGSVERLERDRADMWHAAVSAVFELDGHPVRVVSTQLSPFDQQRNISDANQLLRAVLKDGIPGLLGGDFNCVGSDPGYDPDPYHGPDATVWHPDHVHHVDEHGQVDRRPAIRLERIGRLRDCAISLGVDHVDTTGHHPRDNQPPRRIDRWYATHHLPRAALHAFDVIGLDRLRFGDSWLSDHRPIRLTIDTAGL
ncbi:endonuclease/exonuclease/phosphatase family protein [Nocardia wallacei]|uniref:endonuclease/exonuclease/phosphatase family protein n=1 Tax=Nocardia wallacei TaxID=480035 RepID=UPI002455A46C|nr:endonuclease/exonuclease/phosphatase family protein [Nocardia wallacei]